MRRHSVVAGELPLRLLSALYTNDSNREVIAMCNRVLYPECSPDFHGDPDPTIEALWRGLSNSTDAPVVRIVHLQRQSGASTEYSATVKEL
jgi:hypothetical protein